MDAMEERMMGVLGAVQTKLAKHGGTLAKMSEPAQPPTDKTAKWTEVVRKPRKTAVEAKSNAQVPDKPKTQVKPVRARPLVVIVTDKNEQFPELLKTMRKKVDPSVTGTSTSKMRQTKAGGLLIEINGSADSAETVRAEIARSLGSTSLVRLAENSAPVEILDLDGMTTKEEVIEILMEQCGSHGPKLVSLRNTYGGAQTVKRVRAMNGG